MTSNRLSNSTEPLRTAEAEASQLHPVPRLEMQRRRLIAACVLGSIVNIIIVTSDIFAHGLHLSANDPDGTPFHGITTAVMYAIILTTTMVLAYKNISILTLCRTGIGLIALTTLYDVAMAGGLNTHLAPILLIMPALSSLILRPRDTIVLAICTAIGILVIAVLQSNGVLSAPPLTDQAKLASMALVLVIGSCAVACMAFVTVQHHERSDEKLRTLLLRSEQLAEKLNRERARFEDFSDAASDWLFEIDPRGICTYSAGRYMLSLSTGSERVLGLHHRDIIKLSDKAEDVLIHVAKNQALNQTVPFEIDHGVSCLEGEPESHFRLSVKPFFADDGSLLGYRGVAEDITEKVASDAQIQYMARHDELTGLANRNVVQAKLKALDPAKDNILATLIDLDGFKAVNDTYGHATGDQVLRTISKRLTDCVDEGDIVARLGGDEFLILCPQSAETQYLGSDILSALAKPMKLGELEINLSGSVGQSHFPTDTQQGDQLLVKADLALYAAKKAGRNAYCAFEPVMEEKLQNRLKIERRLRKAIENAELSIQYQPQYCLAENRLLGFEALARWNDQELGCVGPDIFVPIAEECGLIGALGNLILRTACEDAVTWPQHPDQALTLSVNISPEQFGRGDIVSDVQSVLKSTGFPAARLELEITEGVLIADTDKASAILQSLSDLNISIAIDDFGTGYSSLSYLRSLPINRLKIDRLFVGSLHEQSVASITQMIVQMGHSLGMHVMAEGVETVEQQRLLTGMDCKEVQGYLYAKPLPKSQVPALIIADHTKSAHKLVHGSFPQKDVLGATRP